MSPNADQRGRRLLCAAAVMSAALAAACTSPSRGHERDYERLRARVHELRAAGVADDRGGAADEAARPPSPAQVRRAAELPAYVRYALHHNAGLSAAYERVLAGVERIAQVGSLPDPQFTFAQFVDEIQTRTGPQRRRYSLTQAFPWFGELDGRRDVAADEVEEHWQRALQLRLEVERDVAVQFAEYAYLARTIRITRDVLTLLQQLEGVLQQRLATGRSTQADLLRLQVEIGRVENELLSRERVRPSLSAQLAATMNWRDPAPLPLPELEEPAIESVDVDRLAQRADERNPELRELSARARTWRDRQRLTEFDRWPDLQVGVDYFETGGALQPTPGSGDDPWAVRLGFTLPLWRGRYAAAEREAERRLRAANADLEHRRAKLRAELEATAFALDDAARQLTLYRDALLPRAREALEVTRAAYTAGDATVLEVIDSERNLLQFEIAYWRACRDHHQSRARLAALTGGDR